jgi:hypothetical protein
MKKTNILRTALFMLVLALILSLLIACGDQGGNSDNTNNAGEAPDAAEDSVESEETTEDPFARYADELGEHDFGGADFIIQTFENQNVHNRVETEEETGDLINDALFRRNRIIEERFNVNMVEALVPDFDNARTRRVILAGDSSAFDLIIERCPDGLVNWQEGLVFSYDDIPYIDLSKPYWNQSANRTLTLANNQYVAIGAASFSTYEIAHAILFNKEMIQDFNLEDPYVLVRDGIWTFDKMLELMRPVIHDLNGDGVMDENDRFGYVAHPKQVLPSFWIAADTFSVGKDENDIPYLAVGNERFMTAFNKTFEILWDSGAYFMGGGGADVPEWAVDMFANDQSLFIDTTFFAIERMRAMETDFGIIPYPKLNEAQANYVSRIEYYFTTQAPIISQNIERAGVMLEALNSYSARTIIPAFYEVALKTKHARDDDSAEMLDLIINTLVIDIGDTTLCDRIRDGFMAQMFETNNRNLASRIESTERIIQRFVESIPRD